MIKWQLNVKYYHKMVEIHKMQMFLTRKKSSKYTTLIQTTITTDEIFCRLKIFP